jgi:hypothetical protein
MSEVRVQDWLKAAIDTAVELGTGVLGYENSAELPPASTTVPSGLGSYVPLLGPGFSMHIGLVANEQGCADLARALLGLAADEPATQDDVIDAVGEIANLLGGGVKKRLIDREPKLQMGLPLFINGKIQPGANTETAIGAVSMGELQVEVLVIRGNRS